MAQPQHHEPGWDMHDHGADLARAQSDRLSEGAQVNGIVVCHHHFGIGIYIPDRDEYGHINLPSIGPGPLRGPQDFPPIGATVNATVFGYTGLDAQLRLWIYRREPTAASD